MHPSNPSRAFTVAFNIALEPTAIQRAADWFLLCPYFEDGSYTLGQGSSARQCRQVFSRSQADQMVTAFNTAASRRGTNWRGLSVFAGHPDVDPQRWPDERRLGSVVALEARRDGLWSKVAWNTLGRENMLQSYLCYPSPLWLFNVAEARSTGTVRPDELQSVGMTNAPTLAQVLPLTEQSAGTVAVATNSAGSPRDSRAHSAAESEPIDLSTSDGRRRVFNARLDELMAPADRGGRGFNLNQAIAEMRGCPGDRALLAAMGDGANQH